MVEGIEVGIGGFGLEVAECACETIEHIALGVGTCVEPFGMPRSACHAAHLAAEQTTGLGEVDVQAYALAQTLGEDSLCPLLYDIGVGAEIAFFLGGAQAVAYGWYAFHAGLEDGSHRTAVVYGY